MVGPLQASLFGLRIINQGPHVDGPETGRHLSGSRKKEGLAGTGLTTHS